MKCCHFKMTGRGKRLPLLAVFKIRESRFMRNKHNLFFKTSWGDETVFFFFKKQSKSLFIALGKSGTLFFPLCFPSLSFLSCSLSSGVSQWPKPHGRFDQQFCSKAADICPNGGEAFLFSEFPSHASCHLSGKQTCLCCKKILKEEKNVCMKKIEMWEEGHSKRQTDAKLKELRLSDIFGGVWEMLHFWILKPFRDTVNSDVWISTFLYIC